MGRCSSEIAREVRDSPEAREALDAAITLLSQGNRAEKLAACSLLPIAAKMSKRKWKGRVAPQLKRLRTDGDLAVRVRASWIAVREDNEVGDEVQSIN
eukprot:NODE_8966_length_360_cov_11.757377.p3 GENE.NODE_8966_length_360_cov_11.757377~~NODE_8966_length_360_cov_11.757377.p3  ORF type:complete len:98 (-),score=32.40 NODE_8966_length_360_cov_11.757377:49-342(-)